MSQKKKGTREGQVPVCRLLCEVSDDCQAVLRTLLDREVRGRLITILRGEGEMLYIALCVLWSWVSSTERGVSKRCWEMAKGNIARAKSILKLPHGSPDDRSCEPQSYCYNKYAQTTRSRLHIVW